MPEYSAARVKSLSTANHCRRTRTAHSRSLALPLKFTTVAAALALLGSIAQAQEDWREDWRRCAIHKNVPDGHVVISGHDPVEFSVVIDDGFPDVGKVSSVQIDETVLPVRPRFADDYSIGSAKSVLPALARGKRLQVYVEDQLEPAVD